MAVSLSKGQKVDLTKGNPADATCRVVHIYKFPAHKLRAARRFDNSLCYLRRRLRAPL